ncbi:hypothetical protein MKW98_031878 [Papaver atlanticum]|uniref:Uncharacterized protein n=1 Tax=Papaver atlanticum TaxID=357466 RepID=A0AAD4XCY1_9MAGN|nr:hypothetical protein MKW98_031878 [Papaver atlanticum]
MTSPTEEMQLLPEGIIIPGIQLAYLSFVKERSSVIVTLGRTSPLITARFFKDVPEENVQRVITLVRDHFKLVPDDALT